MHVCISVCVCSALVIDEGEATSCYVDGNKDICGDTYHVLQCVRLQNILVNYMEYIYVHNLQ